MICIYLISVFTYCIAPSVPLPIRGVSSTLTGIQFWNQNKVNTPKSLLSSPVQLKQVAKYSTVSKWVGSAYKITDLFCFYPLNFDSLYHRLTFKYNHTHTHKCTQTPLIVQRDKCKAISTLLRNSPKYRALLSCNHQLKLLTRVPKDVQQKE